ncbi:MAG: carboxypeptidase regulatory-like domain-containing protein, partial [Thermodesulfobacteriota bacterium]
MVIYNGESGEKSNDDNRVTSGEISLNGEVLFTHDDFKHQTYTLEVPIVVLESNTLRIELESKPGTYISLEIIQDIPIYDLTVSDLVIDSEQCPDSVDISLLLSNTGEDEIPAGVNVAFYNGNPEEGGVLIGTVASGNVLAPEEVETISFQWDDPPSEESVVYVRVDDGGTGVGAYDEEDETNNIVSIDAGLCRLVFGDSSISGHIIDAVKGDLLAGVQARLHLDENGVPGATVANAESNEEGIFFFPDLAEGSYLITVSHPGYIDGRRPVSLSPNTELTHQDIVLSPVLGEGEFRIVLTWKGKPEDLEAHLTEPNPSGCRYHCYYFNKTTPTANLDLDDRNGYGPETITVTDMVSGTYRYYVHDFTYRYSNTRWLYNSGAKVTVYSGSREPLVFNVPYAYGNVWHVFDVDGESGEIIPVHKMTRQSEPGRIDYPVITSPTPSSKAYWGSHYKYQTKAVDPDNDKLTFSLENGPTGMIINPDTGLLEWTPGGNQKGWYYNIKIKVDDGRCGETSKSFKVYVNSTPTASFSVSPCSGFNPGGDITLTWSTNRVSTVLIDQGIGEVPKSGSLTIPSPEVPTRYTLTAFNDAALVKRYAPTPPGASFYFSPRRIKLGQSTTLYWNSPCSTSRSISHGIGSVPVSGSQVVTPTKSGYYYIYPKNAGGSRSYRAYISVEIPPDYFKISPLCNMTPGEPLTLSWHINNATNVSISPDVGAVEATGTYVVYPNDQGTYTLSATVNGRTVTRRVTFPDLPTIGMSPWRSKAILLGQSVDLRYWSGCADTVSFNQG